MPIFMLKKLEEKHYFGLIFFYFKEGEKATEQKNCVIYGEGTVYNQTRQKWFAKSHTEDFIYNTAWLM